MSVSINAICRKDRINQNRTTNIYLRFTVNRRSRYVSTGINIPADDWGSGGGAGGIGSGSEHEL